jgi:UDP-glucose 4-epimerase
MDKAVVGVFGAAGFLGRSLVHDLVSRGAQVRAVSRSFADWGPDLFPDVMRIAAELSDQTVMTAALSGVTHVVQLASDASPGFGNSQLVRDLETSVIPHIAFLDLCQKMGVRRVVFASSGGTIYGRPAQLPIPETHPTRPLNSYGLTKLVIESYIALYSETSGLDHVILRISNPFGPYQRFRKGQGLVPNVIAHLLDETPVPIYGDGMDQRDYVFIDDVCTAFQAALFHRDAVRQTLNIGSGTGSSVLDVLGIMESLLHRPIPRRSVQGRSTDVARSILDIGRAKVVLGWAPQVSLTSGLQRTLAAARLL